jgi:hypothetical protein
MIITKDEDDVGSTVLGSNGMDDIRKGQQSKNQASDLKFQAAETVASQDVHVAILFQ